MIPRTIVRRHLSAADFWGRPLRIASGGCTGAALGLSLASHNWIGVWLSLAVAFTAFASVVMQFERSDDAD